MGEEEGLVVELRPPTSLSPRIRKIIKAIIAFLDSLGFKRVGNTFHFRGKADE